MASYNKCCVGDCDSTNNTHKLFCMPANDNLRNLWMSFLVPTNPQLLGLNKSQLLKKRVCVKHFDKTQFDGNGVRIRYSYPCLITPMGILHGVPLSNEEYTVQKEHNYCEHLEEEGSINGEIDTLVAGMQGDVPYNEHQYSLPPTSPTMITSHWSEDDDDSSALQDTELALPSTNKIPQTSKLLNIGRTDVPPGATTQKAPAFWSTATEKDITIAADPLAHSEPGFDPDLLDISGNDPLYIEDYGPNINDKLASWLSYIASHGVDKELRKELLQKYLTPANCKNLSGPILNPDIKAATPDYVVKRDKFIEINQKQIAAAITCVGRIISTQIINSKRDKELLENLMDVSRILCDVQYLQSNLRRNYELTLKRDLKKTIKKH